MKKRFLAIFLTAIFLTQGVVPAMGELEEIPAPEEFNIEYEEQDEAFFEDSAPEEENLIFEEPAEELLGAEEETLILEEEDTVLTDDGWAPSDEDLLAEDDFVPEDTDEINVSDSLIEENPVTEPEEAGESLAEAEAEPEALEEISEEADSEEPLEVGSIIASGNCGDGIIWTLDSNGSLTLNGSGYMDNWGWWNDVPWKDHVKSIKRIIFNGSIKSIGDFAFFECSNLTGISFPGSLVSIGRRSFEETGLVSVVFPSSIKSIGEYAFCDCENLKTIGLSGSVEVLKNTFYSCSALEKVSIPEGVKSIEGAFAACVNLKDVTFPSSLKTIGNSAFYACRGMKYITIPDHITRIENDAFSNCSSLIGIKIGNKVSSIGEFAFHLCENLAEVTIPASVKTIEERAFSNCPKLKKIVFLGNAPTFTDGRTYDELEDEWYPSGSHALGYITATAYYPGDNATWTSEVRRDYGGDITWKPYYNNPPLMPPQPRLIAAYNGSKGIGIKFYKAAYATEYVIYRKFNGSWSPIKTIGAKSSELQASGDTLMYTDTTVASNYGKGYIYSVAAKNSTGTSSYDKVGKAIYRLKPPVLAKITNSAAGKATVQWKGVFGKTETNGNYDLQYAEYANGKAGTFKSVIKQPGYKYNVLSTIVSGLKKGKTYVFRIRCSKTNKDRGTFYSEYSKWLSVKITR